MKQLLCLIAGLTCAACTPERSKNHPRGAFHLPKAPALTVQWFNVGGGQSLTSSYLTDSATFRLYVGTFDEVSEVIAVLVEGDQVVVEKGDNGRHPSEPRPVQQRVYSLRKLQQEHAFE